MIGLLKRRTSRKLDGERERLVAVPSPLDKVSLAERRRGIKDCGCVVSRLLGVGYVYPEIHHLNFGGKAGGARIGDRYTVGLNPWLHRGVPLEGYSRHECQTIWGASMAVDPAMFKRLWAKCGMDFDQYLLAEQDRILSAMFNAGAYQCMS